MHSNEVQNFYNTNKNAHDAMLNMIITFGSLHCTRPPAQPELRFFYAVRPETSEGGIQALENHTIAVFPQLPTYEENKAVVVLLRHSVRTRDTPQMPHAVPRCVDMKRCPDTRREWASEEQVVTVFHAGPAYFTGCVLHHILL